MEVGAYQFMSFHKGVFTEIGQMTVDTISSSYYVHWMIIIHV